MTWDLLNGLKPGQTPPLPLRWLALILFDYVGHPEQALDWVSDEQKPSFSSR